MIDTIEPDLLALRHGMEYLMHHPHEPITYSRNKNLKLNEIPHQCFFKAGSSEKNKNKEYSNFLHKYDDAYHAQYVSDICSFISKFHLFNDTVIEWRDKKKSETHRSSPIAETISIYTGVLDQEKLELL